MKLPLLLASMSILAPCFADYYVFDDYSLPEDIEYAEESVNPDYTSDDTEFYAPTEHFDPVYHRNLYYYPQLNASDGTLSRHPYEYDEPEEETPPNNSEEESTPSKDAESVNEESEKPAAREASTPCYTFTGNVSLVSDYRFRGISQTMRHPAIQGGFDYAHKNGIYLGTWASNVDGTTNFYNNASMEWDFYGGYKFKPFPCSAPDFGYNAGAICYYYPGGQAQNPSSTPYNTAEFYLELSFKNLSVKYSQTLTNYFGICANNPPFNWSDNLSDLPNGNSQGSSYLECNITYDLWDKGCFCCSSIGKLNLFLHVGRQVVRHYGSLNYTDWRATLTQEFPWFNVFVTYVGTNANHDYYDVPDNAFNPKVYSLGAQGFVIGVIRLF